MGIAVSLTQVYLESLIPLSKFKINVAAIVAANILLAIATVFEPILFGHIIDSISGRTHKMQPLAMWVGFAILTTIFSVVVVRLSDRLAHRCQAKLLADSFEDFIAMPPTWHDKRGASNVFHILVRACESLFGIWLEFMRSHLTTFVALILLIPTAMTTNFLLGTVLVVLGLAYWWIGKMVMKRTKEGQAVVEKHYHNVFSHISDTISNVSVLHSFNRVEIEAESLRSFIGDLLEAQFPVLDWWAVANVLNRMAATISMTAILLIGSSLVGNGELSVGNVVTFVGFATVMIGRLDQVRVFAAQIFEASSKLEGFTELRREAKVAREACTVPSISKSRGKVEFRNVSFRFGEDTFGINDISFVAEPGQTVAIVGPTGAGKTTIVNLLQRLHEPTTGTILIDGIDISTVSKTSVRDQIAVVLQETGLLNRSIASNIRLGKESASPEEVMMAAEAAAADDFIQRRPGGYSSLAGDKGCQLSGGERQRIAIARAILKSAPILVLDEATSALDVETEMLVKAAIDYFAANRTTFVIAHRLSTIKGADLVLVVNEGRIVESGSYQSLMRASGQFSRLLEASGIAA